MQQVADFEVAQAFRIGGPREEVVVHHAEGEMTVEVRRLNVERAAVDQAALTFPPDPFGEPSEAYGYSRNFDYGEAVRDAIAKLPDRGAGIPDWLSTYAVVATDVEIGGIAWVQPPAGDGPRLSSKRPVDTPPARSVPDVRLAQVSGSTGLVA